MKSKKIVVFSDSHGNSGAVKKIVEKQPHADLYIFLGDGYSYFGKKYDVEDFLEKNEEYRNKFIVVRGNCDGDTSIPLSQIVEISNHRIFCCHGHAYGVSYDYFNLLNTAKANDCDIALYGHTHERFIEKIDNVLIMNPGSCSQPRDGKTKSFGLIEIFENGIVLPNTSDLI